MKEFIPRAITFAAQGRPREIKTPVRVRIPILMPGQNPELFVGVGLWDTGATNSAISIDLAQKMNLPQTGLARVAGVHGMELVPTYIIDLEIQGVLMILGLPVTQAKQLSGADFLIGMDVINQGDFALTHTETTSVFSFRHPCAGTPVDFLKPIVESSARENLNRAERRHSGQTPPRKKRPRR